jgi:diketogulonate reductase-like aldo/keto reductase
MSAARKEEVMPITRRRFVGCAVATVAAAAVRPQRSMAAGEVLRRQIPSSGETIAAVGLGTWITFNVGSDPVLRAECTAVTKAFFAGGGQLIDSSPMYGSSQQVVGHALARLGRPDSLFSADKVWTGSPAGGPSQIGRSLTAWGLSGFDLLQVHNLLAWEPHLDTLGRLKAQGSLRYVGITTSEGRRHDLFERIMRERRLDFVQLTYNPVDLEAEARLLPLAAERGIAVIVNRPFRQGELTDRLAGEPLPDWAAEIDAASWAQVILKFILSHPAVTVVIPATTRTDHVRENVAAMSGPMPDAALRRRISDHLRDL